MPLLLKWSAAALACFLVGALAWAAPAPPISKEGKPSPPFAGTALPEPPRQRQAWAPPKTTLPGPLLTATRALFQAGLADPRGCEYRALDVGTGSCWSGDGGIVQTHGWLLPARAGAKQRFAVCWNGLVYPVVAVREKADLRADVRAAIKADEKLRAASEERGFYRFRHAWSEGRSVAHIGLLPIKACLLLRLGEEELARGTWEAWVAGMRENTNDDAVHLRDPYLMLATDWAWARFDRAVCAHVRADDRLAVLDARALTAMSKAVDAEADRRGFRRNEGPKGAKLSHLSFLGPLPALLADQERRALQKPAPRAPARDKARRIAGLIRALEDARAPQMGQPGGVSFSFDATVRALIEEGEAAVEPLLDCLEKDQRLTRSVQFHRDFFRHREVLGTHRAALAALTGILQTPYEYGGREQVAGSLRAYWNKFKNLPLEERWFLVLADDKGSPAQWRQAAENIARPAEAPAPGKKGVLRGEALRKKKGPSVTELLVRRIDTLSGPGASGHQRVSRMIDGVALVDRLAAWDAPAALPVWRKQVAAYRVYLATAEARPYNAFASLGPVIARFTQRRLQAGDRTALNDYAEWIKTVRPTDVTHSIRDLLVPLWQHPDHPGMTVAAEAMFAAPSPWTERFLRSFTTRDLARTPLVGVAAFRKRLLVELADTRRAGSLKLNEEGYGFLNVDDAYSGGSAVHSAGDPLAPKPGIATTFRVCDYYAWELSGLEGAPRCELYWPVAERDKAVAACAAFLKKYGERFKYAPPAGPLAGDGSEERGRMAFPRLERPATAEDVREGRAIFSLAGAGKVRVCKLPALPARAKWLAYKGAVRVVAKWDARKKKTTYSSEHDQDGVVWQAEEVWKDGKWVRYYGFVGRHVVAKAPAAEVEFPAAGK